MSQRRLQQDAMEARQMGINVRELRRLRWQARMASALRIQATRAGMSIANYLAQEADEATHRREYPQRFW